MALPHLEGSGWVPFDQYEAILAYLIYYYLLPRRFVGTRAGGIILRRGGGARTGIRRLLSWGLSRGLSWRIGSLLYRSDLLTMWSSRLGGQ